LKDIFQLHVNQCTFGSVPYYLTGQLLSGWKFTISQRADGALPVLTNTLTSDKAGQQQNPNWNFLNVYRRVNGTQYAQFLSWRQSGPIGTGPILRPGDYMVLPAYGTNFVDRPNGEALNGFWMPATGHMNHYQWTPAAGATATVPKLNGGTYVGRKFTVAARADGSLPVINQFFNEGIRVFKLCKLGESGIYSVYAEADATQAWLNPGLVLSPGGYLLDSESQLDILRSEFRFLVYMTGYWAKP